MMVIGSALGLVTTTVKVNVPPGASRVNGLAVLFTATTGTTLVIVTVASSESLTWVPAGLTPVTVTTSVWEAPTGPVKLPKKVHGAVEAAGARTVFWKAP